MNIFLRIFCLAQNKLKLSRGPLQRKRLLGFYYFISKDELIKKLTLNRH